MPITNEEERLLELYHYDLLDTVNEKEFDEIVQLASRICKVPISTITLVDHYRQWFKAKVGVDHMEDPIELSFCARVIADDYDLMEVTDASQDERFRDLSNVTGEPNIRFYAGVPLITRRGHKLGTLCVIDSKPGQLSEEQSFALKVLGHQVVKLAEQRLQNRYLHNYQKRLEQQAIMQNRIMAIVAHDVRSPLVSLQGIIELSQENLITEDKRMEMMGLWKKQLDNTMELLTNLIHWGKVQAANDVLESTPINLHEIVANEFDQFRSAAANKNNELVNQVNGIFLVFGDENVFRFIIRNILTNANKFTENGKITIKAVRNRNRVTISVEDSGLGMNQQQIENLKAGKSSMVSLGTRNEKGSGLGFLLIREFIEMMEGEIEIESTPGKGTLIHMSLMA